MNIRDELELRRFETMKRRSHTDWKAERSAQTELEVERMRLMRRSSEASHQVMIEAGKQTQILAQMAHAIKQIRDSRLSSFMSLFKRNRSTK